MYFTTSFSNGASLSSIKGAVDALIADVKHLEEDIANDDDQQSISSSDSEIEKRSAISFPAQTWMTRDIPVVFDGPNNWRTIYGAMQDIMAKTCIRFHVRKADESTYMNFRNYRKFGKGSCLANLGKHGGKNDVYVGCGKVYDTHEIMHNLGFSHEFVRPDRDIYLLPAKYQEQCRHGRCNWFDKLSSNRGWTTYNTPYDFDSIMNYAGVKAKNDPHNALQWRMGSARELSPLDAYRINRMYQCGEESPTIPYYTEWNQWSECRTKGYFDAPCGTATPSYWGCRWENGCRKLRSRFCFSKDPSKCPPSTSKLNERVLTESEVCDASACASPGPGWTEWGAWLVCSRTCGGGVRQRVRECVSDDGVECEGPAIEKDATPCNVEACYRGPGRGGCDFDSGQFGRDYNGVYGWRCYGYKIFRSKNNVNVWQHATGASPLVTTGPKMDHTRILKPTIGTNGFYLLFPGTQVQIGDHAFFLTTVLQGDQCMNFWFHLNGDGLMVIIYTIDLDYSMSSTKHFLTFQGDQGNIWNSRTLTVNQKTGKNYRVMFGVKRIRSPADIAFDDISFKPGACSEESKRDTSDVINDGGADFDSEFRANFLMEQEQETQETNGEDTDFSEETKIEKETNTGETKENEEQLVE